MDNKAVNKAIRTHIWSFLRKCDFSKFTTRTAWRFKKNRIEVVNLQSFNPYLAEGLKCTTFSFAINLGIFLPFIPSYPTMKKIDNKIFPSEPQCHLRKCLKKNLMQKELARKDIWYIDSSGSNLNEVIEDAQKAIKENGLSWFHELNDNEPILELLLNKDDFEDSIIGLGNNPSPQRSLLIGFTAAELGDKKRGKLELENVIKSGCFEYLHEFINSKVASL